MGAKIGHKNIGLYNYRNSPVKRTTNPRKSPSQWLMCHFSLFSTHSFWLKWVDGRRCMGSTGTRTFPMNSSWCPWADFKKNIIKTWKQLCSSRCLNSYVHTWQKSKSACKGADLGVLKMTDLESQTETIWNIYPEIPSRELTYPTWGKGKSSSKVPFWGDMLVPRKVCTKVFQIHHLQLQITPPT